MILTINCGSSSLKYQLYDDALTEVIAKGLIARIGEAESHADFHAGTTSRRLEAPILNHTQAFARMVEDLTDPDIGVIADLSEISAIGHRAVHGGCTFHESTLVTDDVIAELEECSVLAPLHNPHNLTGIREARKLLPEVPQVVVFDTAFHHDMPKHAHVIALPYRLYEDHKIRRYGFHGISCRYVAQQAAHLLGKREEDLRMVICHLGNGVTIDAVAHGRSVDTSIGFGTFSGVMMGTRAGDFDPAVIFHLTQNLGMNLEDIQEMCFKESGLLGVSGVSNDMRRVMEKAEAGDERCQLAVDMFVYKVRKHIGSYAAAMNGIDALVFTAGIGENSPEVRARVCDGLGFLGIEIDEAANAAPGDHGGRLTRAGARTETLVVPTDEENMIAQDTVRLALPERHPVRERELAYA